MRLRPAQARNYACHEVLSISSLAYPFGHLILRFPLDIRCSRSAVSPVGLLYPTALAVPFFTSFFGFRSLSVCSISFFCIFSEFFPLVRPVLFSPSFLPHSFQILRLLSTTLVPTFRISPLPFQSPWLLPTHLSSLPFSFFNTCLLPICLSCFPCSSPDLSSRC